MKLLLFDNYDSFTYNLSNLLKMVRPDWQIKILRSRDPQVLLEEFDLLVISPGPMTPSDVGLLPELFREKIIPQKIPVLGICLGLQFLAHYYQVRVDRSHNPLHGVAVEVKHYSSPLFKGVPPLFKVARYNSLEVGVEKLAHSPLELLAIDQQTMSAMALKHQTLPFVGLQFHPESFLTKFGKQIIDNFFEYYVEN